MKKTIISIILSLIVATVAAQTNHYPGITGTISKSGYSYKYRNAKISGVEATSLLELYNAVTSYLDVKWAYKDGSNMSIHKALGDDSSNNPDFSNSSQSIAQTLAMVDGCFTSQQKSTLRGKSMGISIRINPATGRIADVYFDFFRDSPFANIPVETYRSIELALKQSLTLTVTNEGRRLNYIELTWTQEF